MIIKRTINDKEMTFELAPDELETAYREQERNYLTSDAVDKIEQYCEENGIRNFSQSNESLVNDCITRFENEEDCNQSPNDIWDNVIDVAMKDMLLRKSNSARNAASYIGFLDSLAKWTVRALSIEEAVEYFKELFLVENHSVMKIYESDNSDGYNLPKTQVYPSINDKGLFQINKGEKNTQQKITVDTPIGTLIAEVSSDPSFPGITLSIKRKDGSVHDCALLESNDEGFPLLVWGYEDKEDYSHKFIFDHEKD